MRKDAWLEVKRLASEGLPLRSIAERMRMDRRTVAKAILSERHAPRPRGPGRPRVLDSFRGFIMAKLERYPELTGARLFVELKTMGYAGKYGAVKEFVSELRPRLKPAFHTLRFAPGEMAQADWGHAGVVRVEGAPRKASLFVMVLCHSRMMFADLLLGEAMEHWLEAHWRAFGFFGGVPAAVMVDNCKTAVLARPPGDEPRLNQRYDDFASLCGFQIRPCSPGRPREKGRVESAVGYVKKGFLAGRGSESFEGMRAALAEWLVDANRRIHGTTGRLPAELFDEAERGSLRPLPAIPPDRGVSVPVQATSRFRVAVDTNRYSVPPRCASRRLTIRRHVDRIAVLDGDELVADHPRSYGRRLDILIPAHDHELVARSRQMRERRVVCGLLRLGEAAEEYLTKLRERRPNWLTHAERITALAEAYGVDETARALRDARDAEAFSSEYVLNILEARAKPRPEPGPLHLVRGDDLLVIDLPEPDISMYDEGNQTEPKEG